MKGWYSVTDKDDYIQFDSKWGEDDLDMLAEECAEDYENNYDGWEDSWPIKLYVYSEDKTLMGVFEVEKESVYLFSAYEESEEGE